MLNQENLYQHIVKEQWTDILTLLYTHKKEISTDAMLQQAATIFEQEFFKKITHYPIERTDIEANLDTLYILNYGSFYKLSLENYKTLNIELVKRKPLREAVNYAKLFPDEEVCKTTILKYEELEAKGTIVMPKNINWIEIYNRLFELINIQNDAALYFSGPRFINVVKEIETYYPDYNQYIEQRNSEGKSTSRKIYYYDILLGLKEDVRLKVINRILDIIRPQVSLKAGEIDKLLRNKINETTNNLVSETPVKKSDNPVVFISYSWDDESHKEWVLNLANRLCSDGIDVILDRYSLQPGKNLPHFVEQSITKSERIIIVYTPNYKLKADKRSGGVGYEYSIMNAELYKDQIKNDKVIPILRAGAVEESIPAFMQQFIHIDIRVDDNFENSYIDLLREIFNEPAIQKPVIGVKPNFVKSTITTEEVEKPQIGAKPNFTKQVIGKIDPQIIAKIKFNDTPILTLSNGTKINTGTIRIEDNHLVHYTGKGLREIFRPNTEEEIKLAEELKRKPEEYLVENKYIVWTPLDLIVDINR